MQQTVFIKLFVLTQRKTFRLSVCENKNVQIILFIYLFIYAGCASSIWGFVRPVGCVQSQMYVDVHTDIYIYICPFGQDRQSGPCYSYVYLTRKSSYGGSSSESFVLFVVFRFLCSSIRGGTKRTIACFDCRLQLSCSLRSSLVLAILAGLCAGSPVCGCWLLCTCDNIFIIFASFFRSSPTVGACVNINFSRRFNPDYPLTVKFFTQNFSVCFRTCVCLWLFGCDSAAIPLRFSLASFVSAYSWIVPRLVLRDNEQRRRLLDAIAPALRLAGQWALPASCPATT